jgi:alpha-galactosidase
MKLEFHCLPGRGNRRLHLPVLMLLLSLGPARSGEEAWVDGLLDAPFPAPGAGGPRLQLLRQDHERLERNRSVILTPLRIGSKSFEHGLGTHSVSHLRIVSPEPMARFSAWIGIDRNQRTEGGQGSADFWITREDFSADVYSSRVLRGGEEPLKVDVAIPKARAIDLHVGDGRDGPACDHADWAEAAITLEDGKTVRLDEMEEESAFPAARYPFSFTYAGKPSDEILGGWKRERIEEQAEGRRIVSTSYADPATGLVVRWEATRFADFPALDQVLFLENGGPTDTPIIEDIQALDISFDHPLAGNSPYVLRGTKGAPADPTDYEAGELAVAPKSARVLGGGGGRSSNKDFPFFKVETGAGQLIVAVGWSGQWQARLECPDARRLRLRAGLEKTHFLLHPGERVRAPRMLVFHNQGETLEANARFRRLIHERYAARRNGKPPLPILFSNTCFTRGGGWLNETTAENQISLIKAYAPLGLEAVITDAGWFEGGWPAGAGNWTPRKDAYPDGMAPVAAAARERGMVYGLWFEPERVVAGTWIHKNHPEWVLSAAGDRRTFLLNLGLPEARDHFFQIVKGFMDLAGFRFYRQDFNMDPLPYWRANDAPDRQGITEIKYIEGLYAFWDRIAAEWPDSIREECASGGRRIDLETVRRMHLHQDSDYWFDDDVDQAQEWGLSQYLPNNLFTTPIARLDDYTFRSTLATSLCVGWIADAPGFDSARARRLLDRYREVRHLLVGAWYPLLPYSRSPRDWMASQYHRPDLGEGLVLAFRRGECPYLTVEVSLRGLEEGAVYELTYDSSGGKALADGRDLMARFTITLLEKRSSEMIHYRKTRM